MQAYEMIRRAVIRGGKSIREVAREYGINRRTVMKMLENPTPPGYRDGGQRTKPKLGPFLVLIEEMLRGDESSPSNQRRTAQSIYERLRDKHGYEGSYQQVRVYVAKVKARHKECFVPLVSRPAEAEADFFEAFAEIAGVRRKAHVFLLVLPFSRLWFARAYPFENAESFGDGHVSTFMFLGGVPLRILYDNPAYAVKREAGGLEGRSRKLTESFTELCSTFLFEPAFCAPASGNEKGSVERGVRTVRSKAFAPLPEASSFEELNEKLLAMASAHKAKCERFEEESSQFLPLADYKPCRLVTAKADKMALVHFERCCYSVPFELCGRSLLVRADPFGIEVLDGRNLVARHRRSLDRDRVVTELSHYIGLLERKPRAAKDALPVVQAGLPLEFEAYRQKVYDGTGHGDRRFVAILRLVVLHGVENVAMALRTAFAKGIVEPAAIGLLCMKKEELPAVCTHSLRPGLRAPAVERPPLTEYESLLSGGAR